MSPQRERTLRRQKEAEKTQQHIRMEAIRRHELRNYNAQVASILNSNLEG